MHLFSFLLMLLGQADAGTDLVVLSVDADGFTGNQGHALARLYLPGMVVTGDPSMTVSASIAGGRAHFEFPPMPSGSYAVVVVHDRNDNGRIDHVLGFPSEPLGFSHGFTLSLFSGMPTFEKLCFVLSPRSGTQRVVVR
jgi:uncharacterized protein (DUF2141 family)